MSEHIVNPSMESSKQQAETAKKIEKLLAEFEALMNGTSNSGVPLGTFEEKSDGHGVLRLDVAMMLGGDNRAITNPLLDAVVTREERVAALPTIDLIKAFKIKIGEMGYEVANVGDGDVAIFIEAEKGRKLVSEGCIDNATPAD